MRQFNYLASYRLDSDFPCPRFLKPSLEPPLPFFKKTGLVIVALSHCEPVRTRYVVELMNYIDVDSYGACLKNQQWFVKREMSHGENSVMEMQRNYKFSLVFPNADCDYYMTEKIYSALSAGSVPVWLGTDKIDEVLKWGNLNKSVIKVKDFTSPKALAEYLLRLSQDEKEYNKYLKWKYEGFQFPKEYYTSPIGQWWDGLPLYCRICMKIAQDPQGHNGLPVDKCDGQQKRTLEKWMNNTELKNLR
ncbi:alpha-(1,3)-fucosyltransferase 11-like [Dendronephthya gigantea]|uniref:alpha-(1,3)-fucosyltransferase 11-like n=1 Tax=Dendronephthya gigantea TaxID=151771 RepID=UPI0010697057|nr:alpha-(1,3)-fucosyltransferase 11-like [Dendronephthya gigantea]